MCQWWPSHTRHETDRVRFLCAGDRKPQTGSVVDATICQVNSHVGFKARLLSYIPHDVHASGSKALQNCLACGFEFESANGFVPTIAIRSTLRRPLWEITSPSPQCCHRNGWHSSSSWCRAMDSPRLRCDLGEVLPWRSLLSSAQRSNCTLQLRRLLMAARAL